MRDLGSAFWLSFYALQHEMQKEFQKNGAPSKVSVYSVIGTITGKDIISDDMGWIDKHCINAEAPWIHSYGRAFNG